MLPQLSFQAALSSFVCASIAGMVIRVFVALLIGWFCAVGVAAQTHVLAWQSSTRQVIPLDGRWQRSLDQGRTWDDVQLPRADEGADQIHYRKIVFLDSGALTRIWHLAFGGVRDAAEVTVNGQYLGRFFSGQVPFSVAIPGRILHPGRNTIEIVAIAASEQSQLQTRLQWRAPDRPLGIVRQVALIGSAPIYFERITTDQRMQAGTAVLHATALVTASRTGAAQSAVVRATLLLNGTVVATTDQSVTPVHERTLPVHVELRIPQPRLWTPQSPVLYQLRCELLAGGQVLDELNRDIAVRQIRPARIGNGFVLFTSENDSAQVLPAKGVLYVDQWRRAADGSLHPPDYQRDVQLIEQLGANLVYCAWLAPSQEFIERCNRAGLMVLLDLPFGMLPTPYFSEEELRTRAQNTAIRMRDAYDDHPSVVGYVLANALDVADAGVQEYLRAVAAILRRQDVLRVAVVPAGHLLPEGLPLDAVLVSDQLYTHHRSKLPDQLARTVRTLSVPWALIGGVLVQPFNRNGYADPFSIEAQAEYISQLYRLASTNNAGGLVVRSFCDYRCLYPVLSTNQPYDPVCYEGLLDTTRRRRLGFEMLRARFLGETEPLLQAGSYDAGTPYIFLASGMGAVLLLFWLLNRSRRFREYMLRAFIHPHNFFVDIRDQRILLQGQTLLLAVVIATTYALVLATLLYVTRDNPAADYLSNVLALSPAGKALYIQLAWSPSLALTVVELIVLVKIVVVAVIIRAVALAASRMLLFADALTMVVWALVPMVLFLPVATVLFRLLEVTPPLLWFGVLGATTLWSIARLLRAMAIVFEAAPLVVYSIGAGAIVVVAGVVLMVLQSQAGVKTYIGYFTMLFFP